jgi:hypothetical protein
MNIGRNYCRSIFNPARRMTWMMLKEMPKVRGELEVDEKRSLPLGGHDCRE